MPGYQGQDMRVAPASGPSDRKKIRYSPDFIVAERCIRGYQVDPYRTSEEYDERCGLALDHLGECGPALPLPFTMRVAPTAHARNTGSQRTSAKRVMQLLRQGTYPSGEALVLLLLCILWDKDGNAMRPRRLAQLTNLTEPTVFNYLKRWRTRGVLDRGTTYNFAPRPGFPTGAFGGNGDDYHPDNHVRRAPAATREPDAADL